MAGMRHIKDSYYFEVPKSMWRCNYQTISDFPEVWVRLDDEFQKWEAEKIYHGIEDQLKQLDLGEAKIESEHDLIHRWEHLKHADHANDGKPFATYLKHLAGQVNQKKADWEQAKAEIKPDENDGFVATVYKADGKTVDQTKSFSSKKEAEEWQQSLANSRAGRPLKDYLQQNPDHDGWIALAMSDSGFLAKWKEVTSESRVQDYATVTGKWSPEKMDGYNKNLSGKIVIPQPFGQLKNLYEADSGFCISKFMVIEFFVAVVIIMTFGWLAKKMKSGIIPRGKMWNLLESILLFLRDEVARTAIGKKDGDKFVPLLWTIFLFILGLNLMGMVPWAGAPTAAFAVTVCLACVTLATGIICGTIKFGALGFWANQVPHMDMALILKIPIVPLIFVIEVVGLFIKHGVLAIRLLANMIAGHIVLLGIMGLAFTLEGAAAAGGAWPLVAGISVVASTIFSCLELFVAFLQAYIFTFLSALFIGAAIHHH